MEEYPPWDEYELARCLSIWAAQRQGPILADMIANMTLPQGSTALSVYISVTGARRRRSCPRGTRWGF